MRTEAWREDIGSFANVMLTELMKRDKSVYGINAFDSKNNPLVHVGGWCIRIKSKEKRRFSDPIFVSRDLILGAKKKDVADLIHRMHTQQLLEGNSEESDWFDQICLRGMIAEREKSILDVYVPERVLNQGE